MPELTISSPQLDSPVQSGVKISWDIQDASPISRIKYSWDTDNVDIIFTGNNYPIILTEDRNHTLYVYILDAAGNSDILSFVFLTDDTPPTATFSGIVNKQSISGQKIIIVNPSDTNGIDRVEFYLNGVLEDNQTEGFSFAWITNNNENGEYEVKFIVIDHAGNTYEKIYIAYVENAVQLPLYKQQWFWTMVGAIGAVIAAIIGKICSKHKK